MAAVGLRQVALQVGIVRLVRVGAKLVPLYLAGNIIRRKQIVDRCLFPARNPIAAVVEVTKIGKCLLPVI